MSIERQYKPSQNPIINSKAMKIYLNLKTRAYGVETVDELEEKDFQSFGEFRKEVRRLVSEYHIAGMPVYTSQRCTNDWKNK